MCIRDSSYEPQYFNPMEYQRSPMYSGGGMPPMYNMNNMAQPQNMYPFQPGPEAFTPFQGSVNPLFNNNPYGYGFKFPMPMNPLQTRVMSASSFMGGQSQMPQGQPPMFNQPAAMRMNGPKGAKRFQEGTARFRGGSMSGRTGLFLLQRKQKRSTGFYNRELTRELEYVIWTTTIIIRRSQFTCADEMERSSYSLRAFCTKCLPLLCHCVLAFPSNCFAFTFCCVAARFFIYFTIASNISHIIMQRSLFRCVLCS
eukprot:TRINITY_DN2666_c0_g1_i10.p1 TRINITY_DN2666_c0_g1~~TRINITY_DN2666_c0_g1_i10.p1  ORF type:complete len:255 (-),score=3.96 TRINITY_DN2666_c0_g1_i10:121-885(-)